LPSASVCALPLPWPSLHSCPSFFRCLFIEIFAFYTYKYIVTKSF
jgi:hypothetical protein